jgi:hypothetical protein
MMSIFLGYSLSAAALYIIYRFGSFVMQYIYVSSNILDFGLATFLIAITMFTTNFLLRFDLKPVRKPVALDNRELQLQKERD